MKRLILRLSSLGDVIIASSALEVGSGSWDWVVASQFSEVLEGHPRIGKLIQFDKKTQLKGWVNLSRSLWESRYDEIYDLHCSLRTRLMHVLFWFWTLTEGGRGPRWKAVSKERWKLYSYFCFKKLWPKKFRPTPWVSRYSKCVGGSGNERPNLRHLLLKSSNTIEVAAIPKGYFCIMPSSKWDGKKWPVENYLKICQKTLRFPVIFGSRNDRESLELVDKLQAAKIPHLSGVGHWNLAQAAQILANSQGYLGGDTGLAHLAEAVGVPAHIIFGPTVPDMGFGPWKSESQGIQGSLACRPCGKDGRYCYRLTQKYLCLKSLPPDLVLKSMEASLESSGSSLTKSLPTPSHSL